MALARGYAMARHRLALVSRFCFDFRCIWGLEELVYCGTERYGE